MDSVALYMSIGLILYGLSVIFAVREAPYGRYSRSGFGSFIPAKFGWFIQELPGFFVPGVMLMLGQSSCFVCRWLLMLFVFHYFQRTFIFSFLITGGKPSPFLVVLSAFGFCAYNGFLQGHYLLNASYPTDYFRSWNFVLGAVLFALGMTINIHSDHTLRNLRKSKTESGYKIPRGGFFELVSAANYFGEILEWWGYGIAINALPGYAFAFFTTCMLGKRGWEHHQFYLKYFKEYPKNRKAVIPFVL